MVSLKEPNFLPSRCQTPNGTIVEFPAEQRLWAFIGIVTVNFQLASVSLGGRWDATRIFVVVNPDGYLGTSWNEKKMSKERGEQDE